MEPGLIIAVGVDVSKGKSMVAVRRPSGQIVLPPIQVTAIPLRNWPDWRSI